MNTNVSGPVLGDHWSLDHAILSIWRSRFCEVNKWSYVPQLVIDTNTVQIQNLFLNHWITCFPSANAYLNNFQEAGKFKRMETCMPICLKTFFFLIWIFTQSHSFLKGYHVDILGKISISLNFCLLYDLSGN